MKTNLISKIIKRTNIIIIMVIIVLVVLFLSIIINNIKVNSNEEPNEEQFEYYKLSCENDKYLFSNNIEGYSLCLGAKPEVFMEYPELRCELLFEDYSLYIYHEDCKSKSDADTYIGYSNSLINDTVNYTVDFNKTIYIQDLECNWLSWSRRKLSKVCNDYNYYNCIDLICNDYSVYTFFFKSAENLGDEIIIDILNSFSVGTKTKIAEDVSLGIGDSPYLNDDTKSVFDQVFSSDADLIWGIFDPSTVKDKANIESLEARLGYHFSVKLIYTGLSSKNSPKSYNKNILELLEYVCNDNEIPELTLQILNSDDGINGLFEILDGEYDEFLRIYAEDVAAYGKPVLFRLCNEMNGDWCVYSALNTCRDTDLYKELYKYVFEVFKEASAYNVIWVWNPNSASFPDFAWNNELMYYPGDEYVNVIGMTAYNTGCYYSSEKWASFSELYDDLYTRYTKTFKQPLMITEFACSNNGGDKSNWIEDMFIQLYSMPNIKIAIWWNSADYDYSLPTRPISRQYYLSEEDGSIDAFRRGLTE